jgi:hypothetical protein
MRDGWVEVHEEFYRRDGKLHHRIRCGDQVLYDSIAMNFFRNIEPSLHAHLDMMNSENAKRMYKAMESHADAFGKYFFDPRSTSLVKEGTKAMVVYGH